jgi:hypothetical protein
MCRCCNAVPARRPDLHRHRKSPCGYWVGFVGSKAKFQAHNFLAHQQAQLAHENFSWRFADGLAGVHPFQVFISSLHWHGFQHCSQVFCHGFSANCAMNQGSDQHADNRHVVASFKIDSVRMIPRSVLLPFSSSMCTCDESRDKIAASNPKGMWWAES